MITSIIDEFRFSLPLDNKLLTEDIQNGVQVLERDIVDVMAGARSLFILTALTSREMTKIGDCQRLWSETAELLAGLCSSWSQVDAAGHPKVGWLLAELAHLQSLCDDRMELHCVSAADRRRYVEVRGDVDFEDSFSQRHGQEAKGWTDHSTPQHVYSLGKL